MKPDHSLKKEIRAAILKLWPQLPAEFYGWALFRKVRAEIYHSQMKFPYEDTVMRYARELRDEGAIDYECHRAKSLYIKKAKP